MSKVIEFPGKHPGEEYIQSLQALQQSMEELCLTHGLEMGDCIRDLTYLVVAHDIVSQGE